MAPTPKTKTYSLDNPPASYTVTAPDAMFDKKGNVINIPALNLTFSRVTHVRVNGKVDPVAPDPSRATKTIALTHAQALAFEGDGYVVDPSPGEAEKADYEAKEKAKDDAAKKGNTNTQPAPAPVAAPGT